MSMLRASFNVAETADQLSESRTIAPARERLVSNREIAAFSLGDFASTEPHVPHQVTPDNTGAQPFPAIGGADGVNVDTQPAPTRCARCNAEPPPGVERCPACQSWLRGNRGALRHGGYARRLPDDLKVSIEEFRESLIAAQGGLDALADDPLRAALVRIAVDLETGRRLQMSYVVRAGIETRAGGAAYDRVLASADRLLRTIVVLGMGRRQKRVGNPIDFMKGADL
jgi:hypothetical protein